MAAMDAEVNPDDEATRRAAATGAPASFHPDATGAPVDYISTACVHRLCAEKGACRQTCKFCDAPCACPCHHGSAAALPEPWVDQARGIARELLRYGLSTSEAVPPELLQRIDTDPALFWLRGEERPPGTWHGPHEAATEAVTLSAVADLGWLAEAGFNVELSPRQHGRWRVSLQPAPDGWTAMCGQGSSIGGALAKAREWVEGRAT